MVLPSKIIAYHTGKRQILEHCASSGVKLKWSTQYREWLGFGTYFFAYSEAHAHRWVQIGNNLNWWDKAEPAIISAEIELQNCLYVEEPEGQAELGKAAYAVYKACAAAGVDPPENEADIDGVPVERYLDCAIFNQMHLTRQLSQEPEYDTVLACCQDGPPVMPGSMIHSSSHHQICVRNHDCYSNVQVVWTP